MFRRTDSTSRCSNPTSGIRQRLDIQRSSARVGNLVALVLFYRPFAGRLLVALDPKRPRRRIARGKSSHQVTVNLILAYLVNIRSTTSRLKLVFVLGHTLRRNTITFCFWNDLHRYLAQLLIKSAFAPQRPPIIKIYFHRPPHRDPAGNR